MRLRCLGRAAASALLAVLGWSCKDPPAPVVVDAAIVADAAAKGPVNVLPIPSASVAAAVNPYGARAYDGPTGSLEGTVIVNGDPAPAVPGDFSGCPEGESTYGKLFREGAPVKDGRALADAIVVVTGYKDFYVPETAEAARVTVERCAFGARTIAMTFGQRLEVSNLSKNLVAPVLEQSPSAMLMIATPGGDPVKLYPRQPGHYRLIDGNDKSGHSPMIADLYAFLHPHHAASSADGHYRIDGIPVGKLKVNVMHPAFRGEVTQDVDVVANVVEKRDLVLTYRASPAGDAGADGGKTKDAGARPSIILR